MILDIKVLPLTMFLFQFVKHIIETVIGIYVILRIWWVDPQHPWSQGIGSPIWGSSKTRVKDGMQGLCQDLETGCPKLAMVKFLGIQIYKGDHNLLRLQP